MLDLLIYLYHTGETWDELDFRQLQVEAYEALGKDDKDDLVNKLPCYITAIEGLSQIIGYFNHNRALELRVDYMDSTYRISEAYIMAGTWSDLLNFSVV